jgi:hypothetical protein
MAALLFIISYDFMFGKNISWIFPISYVIFLIFIYFRNIPVLIFLGFCLQYLTVPYYFFENNILISYWPDYQEASGFNTVSILASIFFISFRIFAGTLRESDLNSEKFYGRIENRYIFLIFFVIQVLVILYGASGDTVIDSGRYGQGDVQKGALFEYYFVFLFISLIAMKKSSRLGLSLISLSLVLYSAKATVYGGRIEIVQAILVYLFLVGNFFKGRRFFLFFAIILGLISANIADKFRSNPSEFLNAIATSSLHTYVLDSGGKSRGYISSQYGDVYQSSLRINGLISDGEISGFDRLYSFGQVALSYFLPSAYRSDVYNLSAYKQDVSKSGGGGFIFLYFYAWLSFFGVILSGVMVGLIYKYLYISKNLVILSYCFIISVSFPRWFSYYPVAFFKIAIFSAVIVFLLRYFVRVKFKKSRRLLNNLPKSRIV